MGAFIIQHKNNFYPGFFENSVFTKMGFKKSITLETSQYHIVFYKKIIAAITQYYKNEKDHIFVVGTLIYKELNLEESVKQFLLDYKTGNLSANQTIGQFTITIISNDEISLFTDCSGISNIYYSSSAKTISSSFLAVCEFEKQLKINKKALAENLLTGALIGPETIFTNIYRFDSNAEPNFQDINIIQFKNPEFEFRDKPRQQVISEQLDILDGYFSSIKKTVAETRITIGLTGGFDSRLLMCFAERHFSNIEYFSHWRKTESAELKIAKILAQSVSKELMSYPVIHPLDMSEDQAIENLDQAFYHCDGHIRSQLYWHEAYNTLNYLKDVYQNNSLGLHGVGGEQYRNTERIILPKWNFQSWLKYEVLYRYSSNVFVTSSAEKEFIIWYSNKIKQKLDIKTDHSINKFTLKRYQNEIYNVSNRAVRSNFENKAVFFLSPFAEGFVSTRAYEAIPYLGKSLSFQADMIKKISPQLAQIDSDYGFNFYDGESLSSIASGYLKEVVPKKIFFNTYHYFKKGRSNHFYQTYLTRYDFMKELDDLLDTLKIDLDLKQHKSNKDTGWLLISTAYLLKKFKNKIQGI
ncbi:MAG TPA: hypothetical protein DCG75_17580 [Bacteroidales bacterium]|nr:hypothetical protein [Bacteroidales bacterium]